MQTRILSFFLTLPLLSFQLNYTPRPDTAHYESASNVAKIRLEQVVKGLTSPMALAQAGDERLFIAEQTGTVRIVREGKVLPDPFLDITSEVEHGKAYPEKGLLGLAFHPDFKRNGRFFVYYSTHYVAKGYDHKSVLSEFKVSPENPDKASPAERIILEILQPEANHNGGQLAFGPDGYLYAGIGDGGGIGDKHGKTGNGQSLETLLGKILRIDVNGKTRYSSPRDNPFVGTADARSEIWAYGLRNPWRFSFDRKTGELYCGDIGQDTYEEIDLIEKGGNYGWRAMEGAHTYDKSLNGKNTKLPIHEYSHKEGKTVIGGYVYRGEQMAEMQGLYFYGDVNGKIWQLEKKEDKWINTLVSKEKFRINAFGEDSKGELYLIGQDDAGPESKTGELYKITFAP